MAVSPDRPKGPPLNALRAFEAAARHESFVFAAGELGVSAGAISQHIKKLEEWTGCPLFTRQSNEVVLTEVGRTLMPVFVQAFDGMGQAIHALRSIQPAQEIHIATMPSLAQLWLSERLTAFRQEMRDVQLSITALEERPNLQRELFDISVFLAEPSGAVNETVLQADLISPVCSPELVKFLKTPADLANIPRLLDQTWEKDWDIWGESTSQALTHTPRTARYSLYSVALEEAKAGAGVLMGHDCLVKSALKNGTLVHPFPQKVDTGKALILEVSNGALKRSEITAILFLVFGIK